MADRTKDDRIVREASTEASTGANLLKEMRNKAEAERREILAAADAKVREIEERSKRKCDALERAALSELETELKLERNRVMGEERSAARAERLEVKRTVMNAVIEDARAEIERRIGDDGYRAALEALLREGLAFVGHGAEVMVAEEDLSLCSELVTEGKLDCIVRGDVQPRGSMNITSADGRRQVENGLAARLGRAEGALSAEVARKLFG